MGELNNNGSDQGDPAAWAWLGYAGNLAGFTTSRAQADAWRENGGMTGNVVPLYLRAPGAVAAAPPGCGHPNHSAKDHSCRPFVATAPPGDEDATTDPRALYRDRARAALAAARGPQS